MIDSRKFALLLVKIRWSNGLPSPALIRVNPSPSVVSIQPFRRRTEGSGLRFLRLDKRIERRTLSLTEADDEQLATKGG